MLDGRDNVKLPVSSMNPLSANLRKLRRDRGLSQKQLIAQTGITSVKPIETGRIQSPSYDTLVKLAQALDCKVADFYLEPSNDDAKPAKAPARRSSSPRRSAQ